MNPYLSFHPTNIALHSPLRLTVTASVYNKIDSLGFDCEVVFKSLSDNHVLLLTNQKQGTDQYALHTSDGVYFCKPTDEKNELLLIGYSENNLLLQNNVLKYGIGFNVADLIVKIRLKDRNIFCDIVNGKIYKDDTYSSTSSRDAISVICAGMFHSQNIQAVNNSEESDEEPVYEPARKLSRLLDTAENYSVFSSELEENLVNSIGKISYKNLKASAYDRTDRIAYELIADSIDETYFKPGVQIDIEDNQGKRHTAEIISISGQKNSYVIKVLFSEHIDLSDLNTVGWFTLSFSTVNRDVQLEAIEKLRSGEASSKYMDDVIGFGKPAGFASKNLNVLKQRLQSKKYPPNNSQVAAITAGIETKDIFLVMGPPGTGKTSVILEWVKYFVQEEHKRVLVSSQNNKAVDNVLERISKEPGIDVIRIGSESKVQANVAPYLFENKIIDKRKKISALIQSNIDKLDYLSDIWTDYYNSLQLLSSTTSGMVKKLNTFKQAVLKDVVPVYADLCSLYSAYNDIIKRKQELNDQILKIYNEINNIRNNSNPLKKLFGKISKAPKLSSKLSDLVAELDNICQKENSIVYDYNNKIPVLNGLLQRVYSYSFSDFYSAFTKWNHECKKVIGSKPNTLNVWNLFSKIEVSATILKQKNLFDQLTDSIRKELDRTVFLKNTIFEWQQTIQNRQNYALNELILDTVNLVGATCIGINSQKRFADLKFDVTIIDEAGQIQVHNALVPMSVSNKLIMLGDHKQIPPSVDQDLLNACMQNGVSTELLEKSLFEKMYDELPDTNKIMLDTQYRMPAEIAATISNWFYAGKYFSPGFKKNLSGILPQLSSKPFILIDTSQEQRRFETRIKDAGSRNALEADIIYTLINNLFHVYPDFKCDELGIISAYKSQVKLISSKLLAILDENVIKNIVATLDSFQGQERDLIIYSFVKSSNIPPQQKRIGFLNELRRLNVAMTRCKKTLVLIGDMTFLSTCENMDLDSLQNPVYEKSEKQFSDFISTLLRDVRNGNGEILTYAEFVHRMRNGIQ